MIPSLKCGISCLARVIRLINLCLLAPTVCLALCLWLNRFKQKNIHCPFHLGAVTLLDRWAGEIGQAPGLCDPSGKKGAVPSGGAWSHVRGLTDTQLGHGNKCIS